MPKLLRPIAASLAMALLVGSTMIGAVPASAQGGNDRGGPGCIQQTGPTGGSGASTGGELLQGGNRSDSQSTLTSVIGLLVQDTSVNALQQAQAAIAALNSNNINAQLVCLNNVLNGNDLRILNDVLNNNNVLNNSPILNSNNVPILNNSLNNALQGSNISVLNNVQVVAVDLGSGQVFLLQR